METGKNFENTFRKEVKASEWASDRIKEAFEQVAQDEAEKLSIVQYRLLAAYHRASRRAGRSHNVLFVPALHRFPLGRLHLVGLRRKRTQQLVVRDLWRETRKQPNWLLVVQTGGTFEQAMVFKAHAVPQGLCENLVNALKLLVNRQEDGDGLCQNIVTNLGKESRKGLIDGLREFIKVDNERAFDVGYLIRGTGAFKVWKPKVPEGCLEAIVREPR